MNLIPPDPAEAANAKQLDAWIDRLMDEWNAAMKLPVRPRGCSDPLFDGVRAVVQEIHRDASPFSLLLLAGRLHEMENVHGLPALRHFIGHTFALIEFPGHVQRQQAAPTN